MACFSWIVPLFFCFWFISATKIYKPRVSPNHVAYSRAPIFPVDVFLKNANFEAAKNEFYKPFEMNLKTLTYKDIDKSILKSLPNPTGEAYEIKIKIPEFTFLGVKDQPDFADVYITFYPGSKIIELKSLKMYIQCLRNITVSYERLINIFYDHLVEVYQPDRIRVVMVCNPRGGISSRLTIDSDWKVRGGAEKYSDWRNHLDDVWSVTL